MSGDCDNTSEWIHIRRKAAYEYRSESQSCGGKMWTPIWWMFKWLFNNAGKIDQYNEMSGVEFSLFFLLNLKQGCDGNYNVDVNNLFQCDPYYTPYCVRNGGRYSTCTGNFPMDNQACLTKATNNFICTEDGKFPGNFFHQMENVREIKQFFLLKRSCWLHQIPRLQRYRS